MNTSSKEAAGSASGGNAEARNDRIALSGVVTLWLSLCARNYRNTQKGIVNPIYRSLYHSTNASDYQILLLNEVVHLALAWRVD